MFSISERFQDKFCSVTIYPKTQQLKQTYFPWFWGQGGSVGFCCPHSCPGVGWSSIALLTWPVIDSLSAGDDLAPCLSSSGSFIWWLQGCKKSERGMFQYPSNFQAFTCSSLVNVTLVKASHIAQDLGVRESHKGMGPGRAKVLSIFEKKSKMPPQWFTTVCVSVLL